MDVKCHTCGEPVDIFYFHDVAEEQGRTFDEVRADFYRRGCEALGDSHNGTTYEDGPAVLALQELLGDDIDGLAAMMEDFGL